VIGKLENEEFAALDVHAHDCLVEIGAAVDFKPEGERPATAAGRRVFATGQTELVSACFVHGEDKAGAGVQVNCAVVNALECVCAVYDLQVQGLLCAVGGYVDFESVLFGVDVVKVDV